MIKIKNVKIFNCNITKNYHWSNLPRLREIMTKEVMKFLYGANLYGANLRGADLRGADLYGADLRDADLRDADLYDADLYGANLRGANLYGANLRGADLYGANLYGADLRGADLRGINGEKVSIKDFMIVTGLGSQNRQTFIFYTNIGIVLQCGCFFGTEKEFKKKVKETHKGTNYEKEYMGMLKLAKIRFSRESEG